MKSIISIMLLAITSSAFATTITCKSQYFNSSRSDVVLKFKASSEQLISELVLTLDGDTARKGQTIVGTDQSTRMYPNMIGFSLEGDNMEEPDWGYADCYMSLRLPNGFSTLPAGAKFKGMIVEKASDGGSYNKVFCTVK